MTSTEAGLRLHEEVMLLALRDEKGTLESRAGMYQFALAGALLAELLLAELITIGADRKRLVDLVGREPMHEPLLDECLDLLVKAKRRRSARDWISRFTSLRRLRHRVAEGLCRKGILRDSEDKILLIFTRKLYPTIDPAPERATLARMKRAITSESRTLDPRSAVLIALANATGLLRVHFDRAFLKERKKRLAEITKGQVVGGAAGEAVHAAQAAMMAAIAVSTAVATTARR